MKEKVYVANEFAHIGLDGNPFFYLKDFFPIVGQWFINRETHLDDEDTLDNVIDLLEDTHEMIYTCDMATWFSENNEVVDSYLRTNCEFTGEAIDLWDLNDFYEQVRQARIWNARRIAENNVEALVEALFCIALTSEHTHYVDAKAYAETLRTLVSRGDELTWGEVVAVAHNF